MYPHALARGGVRRSCGAPSGAGDVYDSLVWGNFVHPPTVMVRRTVLQEAGFSDEHLRYSSDYELIIRMSRQTRFAYVDASLLRYRRSAGQMSHLHAGALMQLETVHILEKLRREDPGGVRPDEARGCFGAGRNRSFDAAESIGSADRARAMRTARPRSAVEAPRRACRLRPRADCRLAGAPAGDQACAASARAPLGGPGVRCDPG